jgi:hypothetical protein
MVLIFIDKTSISKIKILQKSIYFYLDFRDTKYCNNLTYEYRMNFMSDTSSKKKEYTQNLKKLTYTNYNYRSANQNHLDNHYSGVKDNYTIFPGIQTNYPVPYETGKCVSKKERTQIGFDIQHQPRFFTDITPTTKTI